MKSLTRDFESTYRRALERGLSTVVVVPCAESLEGLKSFDQAFVEAHVMHAAHVPGCFLNLLGQGVEIKESSVSTHLGFQEQRVCMVSQTASWHDYGQPYRVLVTDRPLVGQYKIIPGGADTKKAGASQVAAPDPSTEFLNSAPMIQDYFYSQVDVFRNTYVQVAGLEQSTAERIREICTETTKKLKEFHKLNQAQSQQAEFQVSRLAYVALNSFLFPHLQHILTSAEERLEKAIRSYSTTQELIDAMPDGGDSKSLHLLDVRECSEKLAAMDLSTMMTPHEKVACIDEAHTMLKRCVAETAQKGPVAVEITGDDILSLFILAVHGSKLQHRLAHVAHMDMYLQGSTGRSGGIDAGRFEESSYACSAFQAALQFFLEERRASTQVRSMQSARGTSTVFSSYLGQSASGYPSTDPSEEADRGIQGLVRSARAQGGGVQRR
eukprot:gnl/TRDRNA2_/TRDRNA2_160671_c0_seq2.p1 gnl/TRDRNA2_/TRDRNA2_160671_c0~~gnl/TRDRNA2_/TRDRNA2_160671_c0_seq2.p1  ORF type:complete len:439 (-),score=85.35 gnl/TRDRNA2_/TRDRNA2_160671_c0_seq2:53-1369(-)